MTNKEILTLFLTLLFWIQITVIIVLGAKLLVGRPAGQAQEEIKTPAMIRNKI